MPRPLGVITIPSNEKDAIICVDKMYRDAAVAEAAATAVPTEERKGKKKDCRTSGKESKKRAPTECTTPVEVFQQQEVQGCFSTSEKVPAGLAGVDGTFTISATLDDK